MSDAVLTLLKLGLLATVYGFFAWVLWAALGQLRSASTPAPVARPRSTSAVQGQVTILEPPELAGSVMSVSDELTIGRAAACSLTLDDTYVSQHHARVVRRDGKHLVDDLGSANGTFVNRERIAAPVVLKPGDRVQIGSTVLEFS